MIAAKASKQESGTKRSALSDIRIVREYRHSPEKIWRLLTEPDLIRKAGLASGYRDKVPEAGLRRFLEPGCAGPDIARLPRNRMRAMTVYPRVLDRMSPPSGA